MRTQDCLDWHEHQKQWKHNGEQEQTTQAKLSYNLISFDLNKKKGHLSKEI